MESSLSNAGFVSVPRSDSVVDLHNSFKDRLFCEY